jgi:hypothetical protein
MTLAATRYLLAACIGLTMLIASCSGKDSNAQPPVAQGSGQQAKLEGMAYDPARAIILGHGWKPFSDGCSGAGTTAQACRAYPEIGTCSGTGRGFCSMSFTKPGQCLRVVTTGGPPQTGDPQASTVDGVRFERTACAAQAGAAALAPGATSFAAPICEKLRSQGISKTVLIDNFIPGYPAALQDSSLVEREALSPDMLADLVRGLSCGAGLAGFGPDVPEAALPLFQSKRHGKLALAALSRQAATGNGAEAKAAREFLEQMRSYLRR